MNPKFKKIEPNDRDWDEDFWDYDTRKPKFSHIGTTPGCHCCSEDIGLTPELLDEHIASVQTHLAYCLEVRSTMTATHE
jgi:hypothetical protein